MVAQNNIHSILSEVSHIDSSKKTLLTHSHPLRFSTTSNGTHGGGSEYLTGVSYNGTPGQDNAWTEISVASDAPANLYYYCKNHSGMGGVINITG